MRPFRRKQFSIQLSANIFHSFMLSNHFIPGQGYVQSKLQPDEKLKESLKATILPGSIACLKCHNIKFSINTERGKDLSVFKIRFIY